MRLDVTELNRFYTAPIGRTAHAMIARRLNALWPRVDGLDMLGLGYATPFLSPFAGAARRVVAAMPAAQGVQRWPADGRAGVALIDEPSLPFRDAVFDRIVLVHTLEETDALRPLLREVWRVAAPEARLVVVASSRRGVWSRLDTSPFGHGRSFSKAQLSTLLRGGLFEPVAWSRALYVPPIRWGPVLAAAEAWERAGERLWPRLGGVILVEAVKRVAVEPPRGGRGARVFAPAPVRT